MLETTNQKESRALNAAVARVERLPLPTKAGVIGSFSTGGYSDDPYVDCPYDDYQDYNDSSTEDD